MGSERDGSKVEAVVCMAQSGVRLRTLTCREEARTAGKGSKGKPVDR